MIREKFNPNEEYPVTKVDGKHYLFIGHRVSRESIPSGLVMYETADGDGDGCFARVKKNVLVNFWGTLIGTDRIADAEDGAYYPEYGTWEYEGTYTGPVTLAGYLAGEYDGIADGTPGPETVLDGGRKYRLSLETEDDAALPAEENAELLDDMDSCMPYGVDVLSVSVSGRDVTLTVMAKEKTRTAEVFDAAECALEDAGAEAYADYSSVCAA